MYNFTFDAETKQWIDEVAAKLPAKMRHAVEKAQETDFIPYSTQNDEWKPVEISWWTNGFWPALCWQLYLATGDDFFRNEAVRTEEMLDVVFKNYRVLSHDNGFMWLINSGVRFALEHNKDSFDRTLFAAKMLACRYNPNSFIRAWQGRGREGWAIVDCLMNLPMLYWASDVTGDPRYKLMAMKHADTAMTAFIRPDGSSNHIVIFDPETGEMLDNPVGQGYASGSCWSRGLSWAVYGYTLSYMATGKQDYLDVAKRTANHFLLNLIDDPVPLCDFRQPAEPRIYDTCAGAIAACGMLELGRILPEGEREPYIKGALRILKGIESRFIRWDNGTPALLNHCTAAWHDLPTRHMTMIYADYFFIEAIYKLKGEERLFWLPHFLTRRYRLFTEYLEQHDLSKLLGKPGSYQPFPRRQNRAAWDSLHESVRQGLIEWGNEANAGYPMLTASQFLAYSRTGDRQIFEQPYFARRKLLIGATFAECVLDDAEHLDAIIDGLWAICEESTWVVSAHNDSKHLMTPPLHERPLPDINNPYIDLFAAQTSATLAWVLYFMEDKLDAVTPRIARRVRGEIERRIVQPFRTHDDFWWMGMIRKDMNNWTPWILSNILYTVLLLERDEVRRCQTTARAMRMLDSYLAVMPMDGGCDEGAGYFNVAGASLLDCLEAIYEATNGQVSFYHEEHIRNLKGTRIRVEDTPQMNRLLYGIFDPIPQVVPPQMPEYMEMPNLQVFAWRKNGLYAAIKGGHNGESHNHNDIGTFIIYADDQPMVVDMGNKLYTAKTFGPERYTLGNTRSMNHNIPLIGDVEQQEGREYHAQVVTANEHGAELLLTTAYPDEACLSKLSRTFSLQEDGAKLRDCIELTSARDVTWVFMLRKEPVCEPGKVTFGPLVLHHDPALIQTVTEMPITDVRLKKNFPGSLWRLALKASPAVFFEHTLTF